MNRKMSFLVAALACVLSVVPLCHAESLSCSNHLNHVVIEAGPLLPKALNLYYPRAMEPDERAYDNNDDTVLTEWVVNIDGTTDYPVAYCHQSEDDDAPEAFLIPPNIHRCLLDHGKFTCAAGTMACRGGGKEKIVIEKWKRGERVKEKPVVLYAKKGKLVKWAVPETNDPEVTYLARCFQRKDIPWAPRQELDDAAIPHGMKLCVLNEGERFICTDNPNRHDAFWPDTP